jgi:hypothetical protein
MIPGWLAAVAGAAALVLLLGVQTARVDRLHRDLSTAREQTKAA